jgi:nickel transport protein
MIKKILITQALICSLFAHDMWVDDALVLHYGHKQMKDAHGKNKEIKKEDISKVFCSVAANVFEVDSKELKAKCDTLFIVLNEAYYTKTPYGTKKQSKDKTKMALSSFKSIESIKRINNDEAEQIFNKGLELSLTNKLSNIEVGDKARLLVTFNGKAKSGVSVALGDKVRGASDEDGHINIRIQKAGLQNIKASLTLKGDGIKSDEIIHSTTLNIKVLK